MCARAAAFAVLFAAWTVAPALAGELPTAFTSPGFAPLSEAELAATRAGQAGAPGVLRTETAAGVRSAAIAPVRVQGAGITIVHINTGVGSTQTSRVDIDMNLAPGAVLDLGLPTIAQ